MDLEVDVEPMVTIRPAELTRIEPASFRGVDCAVLAERYVAFRLGLQQAAPQDDPDVIKTTAEPSSENV